MIAQSALAGGRHAGRACALAVAFTLAFLLLTLLGARPAFAEGSPWLSLNSTSAPTSLPRTGEAQFVVTASNLGEVPVNATGEHLTLTDELPAGVRPLAVSTVDSELSCPEHPAGQMLTCTFAKTLAPYESLSIRITVQIEDPLQSPLLNVVKVQGGATPPPAPLEKPLKLQSTEGEQTPFGVETYALNPETETGAPDTQAGSHPFQLTTTLDLNQTLAYYEHEASQKPGFFPSAPALVRNLRFKLPAGLVADASALPQCTDVQFSTIVEGLSDLCPPDTAVGVASVFLNLPVPTGFTRFEVPVFNLVPAPGEPARFGFEVHEVPVVLDTSLPAGGEYAAQVSTTNTSQAAQLLSGQVTIWGVPGDPRHDSARGWECLENGRWEQLRTPPLPCEPSAQSSPTAFLTLPTSCEGAPQSGVSGESWPAGQSVPEQRFQEGAPGTISTLPKLTGCSALEFAPSVLVEPEVHSASTPTGLDVGVEMPQPGLLAPEGRAESALKQTTVKFPPGLQLNPSAANALEDCTAGEFDFLNQFGDPFAGAEEEQQTGNVTSPSGPAACPDAAKVGTVRISTPLLSHELTGSVYLAAQNTSPFRSPLALYLVAEDTADGIRVKLAGTVEPDPSTGQLTSTFRNTPQLPFTGLHLHFFGGERASLSTPAKCGAYTVATSFTAWSGESGTPESAPPFQITSGPGGSACANPLPFAPAFQAGAANAQAGALTPFTVTIGHSDSDQPLQSIDLHLPPGILALIAQVTPCPEAQALADACPPESLVGHTTAIAGLGNEPVTLPGQLYLTGALKATSTHAAAPFGLLAVTHAAVGPFDLGDVTVLSTIEEDLHTAAVTVQSESIPRLIKGVPAQLKQLQVTVERPGNQPFEFNPTNCDPMSITGALSGYEGATAPVSYPFQVTGCAALPFKPTLTASTQGHSSKVNGASLTVKVTSGPGQANIAKTTLTLPIALPSRLTTIQKACLAAVFEANPASCPEGSNIGTAVVHTPVLKSPVTGPAYLVSHGGAAFPDVEFVLQGEGVTLILDGQTNIKKGITTSTFNAVPDAPVTTFETTLPEGPHSALAANVPEKAKYSLCGSSLAMPTKITGQNGAVIEQTTKIAVTGCGGVKAFKATRAQLLARALKACRSNHKHSKKKRLACEKQARKKYVVNTNAKGKKKHARGRKK